MFGALYLSGGDAFPPFDVQQSQDVVGICVDVVKTRGRPAFLVAGDRTKNKKQSSSAVKYDLRVCCTGGAGGWGWQRHDFDTKHSNKSQVC